jgi:anti-sigma factor RsiW
MEGWRLADLHAYVDDCLEPGERRAFEAQMAATPALSRRAAQWQAQNKAIRAAFDEEGAGVFSIDLGRQANERVGKGRRAASPDVGLACAPPACRSHAVREGVPQIGIQTGALNANRLRLAWRLRPLALSACLIFASAFGPASPLNRLGEAGVAAFGAFALPGGPPLEFATRDPRIAQKWLMDRLAWPVRLPPPPSNVGLVGVRIAPASRSAAAFLVYETGRSRLGLLVQTLDAPPRTAPEVIELDGSIAAVWTGAGQVFVLVGDLDAPSLRALATAFFNAAYELGPPVPERGS